MLGRNWIEKVLIMKTLLIITLSLLSFTSQAADLQIKSLSVRWSNAKGKVVKAADGTHILMEKGKFEYSAEQSGYEHEPIKTTEGDIIKVGYINPVGKIYVFAQSFKGFSCPYRNCYLKRELTPKFTKSGIEYFEVNVSNFFPNLGVDFYLSRSPVLNKNDSAAFLHSI